MVQAVASWDENLYGCPRVDGYQANRDSVLRIGEPVDGPQRYRINMEEPLTRFSVTVPQTQAQYDAWVVFFESVLDFGLEWFSMDLALGTDVDTFIVHVLDDWSVNQINVAASFGELQLELEAFDAESSVLIFPPPIVVDGGSAGSPSPAGDVIDAGTATSPSPDTDVVFGGDYVDIAL